MHRHIQFLAVIATCFSLLTACVGISGQELKSLGSVITPASINFEELYGYAGRARTAYDTEANIRAKYPATIRIAAPDKTDVRYFLERNDKAHAQYITVRGSADKKNFQEDLDITVREDRTADIPVHAGFDLAARAIYSDVKPYLRPGYKTYVTGHSLGGAVAALLTIYMIEDKYNVERVVTFGQPRFTTAAGVKRLGFLPLTRVVDENDMVPMLPPATALDPKFGPYMHVGPEIILLEGPDYVYLTSHDATRIDVGEFWRTLGISDLKDHKMDKYLLRLTTKFNGAVEVSYNKREHYVTKQPRQATAN